ncbi:hypothetical protein F2Q68_00023824 [Brassica cretica]|uniref:Transmembrane protein n=1 Tax=Brassica cretica TaxID=69181 RepID=A0A8S9IBD5_BRACR|nr:hypothetical protein F2Q68_00023824 [Brassica cretica]
MESRRGVQVLAKVRVEVFHLLDLFPSLAVGARGRVFGVLPSRSCVLGVRALDLRWSGLVSWRFISHSASSGKWLSCSPVKLDFGFFVLRRRVRRGVRYCVVVVAVAFSRVAVRVLLFGWPSMTSEGPTGGDSGFVLSASPLLVLLFSSSCGCSPLRPVYSFFSAVLLRRCFANEAIWSYHRFSMLARGEDLWSLLGLRSSGSSRRLVFRFVIPFPLSDFLVISGGQSFVHFVVEPNNCSFGDLAATNQKAQIELSGET